MRDILLISIVLGVLPFAIKRPYIGLLLYSWLSYMNPHRLTWGFAYDFPFAQIAAIVTIGSLFLSNDKQKIKYSGIIFVWALWLLWMNLSTLFALDTSSSLTEWDRAMKIQLMSFLTIIILNSKEKIIAFIFVLVLSIAFYGVKGGIFSILTGGNYIVWGPAESYFEGNNALAVALLMIAPLLYFIYKITERKWVKICLSSSAVLICITVLTTYSRGAFVAISAMSLYMLIKSKHKVAGGVFLVVIVLSVFAIFPEKWSNRIETIQSYEQDSSALGRINAWWFGFNVAKDYPVFGGGYAVYTPDNFKIYAPNPYDFHDAHSIYFEALAEHGFGGLILFLLLGMMSLKETKAIINNTKGIVELEWACVLAKSIRLGLIGYAVGGAFLGLAYFDLYYHLIALIVVLRMEVDRSLSVLNHNL